jgi:hypothetical protein
MNCAWCGTKGGSVNRLVLLLTDDVTKVLIECQWCVAGALVK